MLFPTSLSHLTFQTNSCKPLPPPPKKVGRGGPPGGQHVLIDDKKWPVLHCARGGMNPKQLKLA